MEEFLGKAGVCVFKLNTTRKKQLQGKMEPQRKTTGCMSLKRTKKATRVSLPLALNDWFRILPLGRKHAHLQNIKCSGNRKKKSSSDCHKEEEPAEFPKGKKCVVVVTGDSPLRETKSALCRQDSLQGRYAASQMQRSKMCQNEIIETHRYYSFCLFWITNFY